MHEETTQGQPAPRLAARDACSACGARLARKWGPDRATLLRYCANEGCTWFGVPSWRHVKHVVIVEDDGTVRERHRESYAQRGARPRFGSA